MNLGIPSYVEVFGSNPTAKVEGINNKIKTLKRQVYGFRDMDYSN